ncbi:Uncharacterised protein [Mycobacteroides abscessus subsp. abscessus]|nr:Uncharacterised protein [Mycobacteroides abscessus subsp. abscessus]
MVALFSMMAASWLAMPGAVAMVAANWWCGVAVGVGDRCSGLGGEQCPGGPDDLARGQQVGRVADASYAAL